MRLTLVPFAVAALAATLAACQSNSRSSAEPIEGNWAADDGSFIATFNKGAFSSRLISTGETVVSDGGYARSGSGIQLSWTSLAANEPRSASCTFLAADKIACEPSAGQRFTMTRVA